MTSAAAPDVRRVSRERPVWPAVGLYYLLACVISWPFFWRAQVLEIPTSFFVIMWGLGIAAVVAVVLFRSWHTRTITFFGAAPVRSVLFYLAPMLVLLSAVAITAEEVELSAAFLVMVVGRGFFQVLGEELGCGGSSRTPSGRCPGCADTS